MEPPEKPHSLFAGILRTPYPLLRKEDIAIDATVLPWKWEGVTIITFQEKNRPDNAFIQYLDSIWRRPISYKGVVFDKLHH